MRKSILVVAVFPEGHTAILKHTLHCVRHDGGIKWRCKRLVKKVLPQRDNVVKSPDRLYFFLCPGHKLSRYC
jgi:hypothetical protein